MSSPRTHCLSPIGPSRERPLKFLACDVETDGIGGAFIAGCVTDGESDVYFTDREKMCHWLLQPRWSGYRLGFHNLEHDIRYFLDVLRWYYLPRGYTCDLIVQRDDRVIAAIVREGRRRWEIVDTYALMPVAERELSALGGIEKLDIGLSQGVTYDHDCLAHRDYLRTDCHLLYRAYGRLCGLLYDAFQVHPGYTIGATAIKCLRRTLKRAYWRSNATVERFAREAYYGGLTFLTTTEEVTDAIQIDAHGAYIAAMGRGVPVGLARYEGAYYHPTRPGFYRCRVHATEAEVDFAFLPARINGAVRWPHAGAGRAWTVTLPSHSIELGRKAGYHIEVIEGYTYPALGFPFQGFIERCDEMEHRGNAGLALVVKFLRNACYGKFGQQNTAREYMLSEGMPELSEAQKEAGEQQWSPVINHATCDWVDGLWWREVESQKASMHIEWAAWITASARQALVDAVGRAGTENVVYGDTDSLVVRRDSVLARDAAAYEGTIRYGDWRVEREYHLFRALGPKCYSGITVDGEVIQRHKGIPRGAVSYEEQRGHSPEHPITAEYRSIRRALAADATGVSYAIVKRSLSSVETSRGWMRRDGAVVPKPLDSS